MELIRIAFNFVLGCFCVLALIMATLMIAYIANITVYELFHVNIAEELARRLRK